MLGPLEVIDDGVAIDLGGRKQRTVLALLVANAAHQVSTDRLILGTYGEEAGEGARRSVQTYVSSLRRRLGDVIVSTGHAYELRLAGSTVARATLRLATRMLVELADGSQEALAAVVNLSAVGLLLETDAILEPGQFVIFSIDADPDQEPVSGKAEVVRKADPEHDGIEGIGVRFISFEGDSRQRLEAILGRALHLPIDEIRTTS